MFHVKGMQMKKVYSICEYEYFTREKVTEDSRYCPLPSKIFDLLLDCILAYPIEKNKIQTFFLVTQKRRVGTVIQATNYVGTFLLKNGVGIEILPKIVEDHTLHKENRKIFLQMLMEVWKLPIKKVEKASLQAEKNGFFWWFITIFLKETEILVKQGLSSEYHLEESNENFLKGKLLFSKQITKNSVHQEHFYVEKDVFNEDRPENRLIKATLLKVNKVADSKNKARIKRLLSYFYQIDPSFQVEKDFGLCKKDRSSKRYNTVLEWCQIFLNRKKFGMFYGNEKFLSLFFPMDQLFEQYVAKQIYQFFYKKQYTVKTQIKGTYLLEIRSNSLKTNCEEMKGCFELIPDIAIWKGKKLILLDTKWKLLNIEKRNYGITQDDIYQMFAYGVRYQAKKVLMLYPKREKLQEEIIFNSKNNVEIKVVWVDLLHMDQTLESIRKEIE
ncbi:hypothetical protein FYJ58_01240 [Lachnospiraceae bacterium WCA-693-APC-MOT-I]|uniref:Restriction endonuclease n=2 Tax=Velocimicrobium porci TaxID=2606634 RepID=A0A6L5XVZ0_9FIRM|nr:hypothetical protein [Velocimicrobium porci]